MIRAKQTGRLVKGLIFFFTAVFSTFVTTPVLIAGENGETELQAAVADLGLDLQRLLATVPQDGKSATPSAGFNDLEHRLQQISEAAERIADAAAKKQIDAKIEQLQGLMYNLRLVATSPSIASELPSGPTLARKWNRLEVPAAAGPPINNGCANPVSTGLGSWSGETGDATNDGKASCGASFSSPDVWYHFTAPYDGLFYATTVGSDFDTVLSTYTVCPGTLANEIECNDDFYGLWSSIGINANAGDEVLIRVAGAGGATGTYQLTIDTGARIAGRITTADGGDPIVDIRAKVFSADGGWIGSDFSDANGEYEVSGLNQAEHFVGTAYGLPDYLNELYDNIPCPQGVPYSCETTDGDPVLTTLGAVTSGIDFELDPVSVISGTVSKQAGGQPIEGAVVHLFDDTGDVGGFSITDELGNYEFDRLLAGSYYLLVDHDYFVFELWEDNPCPGDPPYACNILDGDPVHVPVATTVSGIDFVLQKKGVITGVVTESLTGLPIAGASVETVDGLYRSNYTVTAPDGSYMVEGLEDGDHFLIVSHNLHFDELYNGLPCEFDCDVTAGTPISAAKGTITAGVDVDLVPLGTIGGTVTEAGSELPLEYIRVNARDASAYSSGSAYTDASGVYSITGLLPGDHFVWTDTNDHVNTLFDGVPCDFGCDHSTGTPVLVQLASTSEGIDFALEPTGGVSGIVTDEASGSPVQFAWVRLWHPLLGSVETEYTDSAGQYQFDRLSPGSYFVVVQKGEPFLDELFDGYPCLEGPPDGCDPTKGTAIIVEAGETTSGIDISLTNLENIIFTDGFESGGMGAWTSAEPL